jgi:hypothetical protein
MSAVALSGSDTIVINGYLFVDLADENVVELTFPSDIAQVKTGKNGNSIYGLNETGKQCEMKLRVLRGGADDQFLNNLLIQQQANFAGTVLMQGTFIKKIGDGQGNITSDTYVMSGGVFTKQVEGKSNVAGDTEQSLAIYMIKFSNSPRAIT